MASAAADTQTALYFGGSLAAAVAAAAAVCVAAAAVASLTLPLFGSSTQLSVSHFSIGCSLSAAGSVRVSIGPAAVKQAKRASLSPGLSESCRGSPRQHHCVLCAFFPSLPGDSYLCEPQARCPLFILGGGVGLLLSLPQTCREILLVPADARFPPHRTAPRRTAPLRSARLAGSCCCH